MNAHRKTSASKARMWIKRRAFSLRNLMDALRDRRICGMSLERYVASQFPDRHGIVDTVSTPYGTLEVVLGPETFSHDDILLDVGCGLGRPLAYLVGSGFTGQLVGAEINHAAAVQAQRWTKRYDNIRVVCTDVFDMDISSFTKFFMWYSMTPDMLARFISKVENETTQPIRFYYVGNRGQDVFEGRAGWRLARSGCVDRVHGIPQHGQPVRYSVWDFPRDA